MQALAVLAVLGLCLEGSLTGGSNATAEEPSPGPGLPQPTATQAAAATEGVHRDPRGALWTAKQSPAESLARHPKRRAWDPELLPRLARCRTGEFVRFELVDGQFTSGKIGYHSTADGALYVSGKLIRPESGRFFFQKQTVSGVAGDFVGVVEFPGSRTAFRLEPTGPGGAPELVKRPWSSVLCVDLPRGKPGRRPGIKPKVARVSPADVVERPIPPYQQGIVVLESLPGARAVLYLDFAGGWTAAWGGISYARPELNSDEIREIWARVAEDFLPFTIDVTTDLQVFQRAREARRQRVIITPTDTAAPGTGGTCWIGSFNWTGDTPGWVFSLWPQDCAEACSHELGHALGLSHDGVLINQVNSDYSYGHGSGETGWAPIMGCGYGQNVTQWSKGEYLYANNTNDQLLIISARNNGVTFRGDDTGDSLATSRYLEIFPGYTAGAVGVIERPGDTDCFQFTTDGGLVSLRADPTARGPNLALKAALCDVSERVLASSNPQTVLGASLSTNLPAGTYSFKVTGAGRNDPVTNGFSAYGSLGFYSITGLIARARLPDRFQVAEHAPNGTILGQVQPRHKARPLAFVVISGDPGNTFEIDGVGHLSVRDNTLLDYEQLAVRTPLAIQFELLLNIIDLSNASLSETNRRVVIAVLPAPPLITEQPQDIVAVVGGTASLTLGASASSPPQIQWFFNGAALPDATGFTLGLTNVQLGNAGEYWATALNRFAAVTSRVAVLTVVPVEPIRITRQPADQVVSAGQALQLSVGATASLPLSYQWKKDGTNLAGRSTWRLNIENATRRDAGSYSVLVSSPQTSIESSRALIRVISPERLKAAAWTLNGDFRVTAGDCLGVELLSEELPEFRVQVSTNLIDWEPLVFPLNLTTGGLSLVDPTARNYSVRFYRIIEHPSQP